MLGQLQDVGNTLTLAHYPELLGAAGLLTGIPKFAGETVRQRASSPKLQVLNTALMSAMEGLSPDEAREDRSFHGRLVESAVGAHLANAARVEGFELFYWRDRNREVDFVVRRNRKLTAIEVKSGLRREGLSGISAFAEAYQPGRCLLLSSKIGRNDSRRSSPVPKRHPEANLCGFRAFLRQFPPLISTWVRNCPTLCDILVAMNNPYTEIAFVLDRSGSMAAMHDVAVEGFNHFLAKEQAHFFPNTREGNRGAYRTSADVLREMKKRKRSKRRS